MRGRRFAFRRFAQLRPVNGAGVMATRTLRRLRRKSAKAPKLRERIKGCMPRAFTPADAGAKCEGR